MDFDLLLTRSGEIFDLDTHVYVLVLLVTLFGSYLIKNVFDHALLACFLFPFLLMGSLVMNIAFFHFGLIEDWRTDYAMIILAACSGLSVAVIIGLSIYLVTRQFSPHK